MAKTKSYVARKPMSTFKRHKKPLRNTKAVRAESAGSKVSLIRNPVQKMVYINTECTLEPIQMTNLNQSGTTGDNRYSLLRYQYKDIWASYWP